MMYANGKLIGFTPNHRPIVVLMDPDCPRVVVLEHTGYFKHHNKDWFHEGHNQIMINIEKKRIGNYLRVYTFGCNAARSFPEKIKELKMQHFFDKNTLKEYINIMRDK